MRDVFKTAKQGQMAPVRGRVKAMMAQPRAIPQARKIARQTTGFQKGGITDSPTKVINRLLSDEKGKPHSTTEGKEASIKRLTKRVLDRYIKKGQQQGLNPGDVRSALDLVGSSKGSFKDFLDCFNPVLFIKNIVLSSTNFLFPGQVFLFSFRDHNINLIKF